MSDRLLTDLALKGLIEIEEAIRDNQTKLVLAVWGEVANIVAEYNKLLRPRIQPTTYQVRQGRIAVSPDMRARLIQARKAANLSQSAAQRQAGIGRNIVFALESGTTQTIDPTLVPALAACYGVSATWLQEGEPGA